MQSFDHHDIIVAQATAVGNGAIGIIRGSGIGVRDLLEKVFKGKVHPKDFESHRFYLGHFINPKTKEVIDQIMVVWFKAPHSYTGEDVFEIQAHGAPIILTQIMKIFVSEGARVAEPGEFSKRAFLNGKMDLSQAEAVCDLIAAKSEKASQNALSQLGGYLSKIIDEMKQKIISVLATLEAGFDFVEEDVQLFNRKNGLLILEEISGEIKKLLDSFHTGQLYKEGLRVAIIGRPNVGKSSLLNCLLKEEKAIIHDQPGTTRDVVEGERKIQGIVARFYDTAGIRESKDVVESEGIRRSIEVLNKADLVYLVLDGSQKFGGEENQLLKQVGNKQVVVVVNKVDLCDGSTGSWFDKLTMSRLLGNHVPNPDILSLSKDMVRSEVSCKTGKGLEELLEKTIQIVLGKNLAGDSYVLNNLRHQKSLEVVWDHLSKVMDQLKTDSINEECLVEELRLMVKKLSGITSIDNEMVLDEIFSRFCIGK